MKKMITLTIALLMAFTVTVPAYAAELPVGYTEEHPSNQEGNPVKYLFEDDIIVRAENDTGDLVHFYRSTGDFAPWYLGFIIEDDGTKNSVFLREWDQKILVYSENETMQCYSEYVKGSPEFHLNGETWKISVENNGQETTVSATHWTEPDEETGLGGAIAREVIYNNMH